MPVAGTDAAINVGQQDIDEARAFNAKLEALIATRPAVNTVPIEVTRRARRQGNYIFPAPVYLDEAREVEVAGRGGPVKVRIIQPDRAPVGIYLHMHGGGWTLGAADEQDLALKQLANETRLCAASIEYRLAPEHPYPAGPDDCEDAVLDLLEQGAQLLGAPARFAIGGESAGAHLAVVTLLRLRDQHEITNRIFAASLAYGGYDLNSTPSQILWGDRNLVLSLPIAQWFGNNFVPGLTFEQRRDPDVSPLYARLDDLPPALFTVGTMDPAPLSPLHRRIRQERRVNSKIRRIPYAVVAQPYSYPIRLPKISIHRPNVNPRADVTPTLTSDEAADQPAPAVRLAT
jgi:acetyl esterase